MRKPYAGEALDQTSLASLGLSGQTGKFQVQYSTGVAASSTIVPAVSPILPKAEGREEPADLKEEVQKSSDAMDIDTPFPIPVSSNMPTDTPLPAAPATFVEFAAPPVAPSINADAAVAHFLDEGEVESRLKRAVREMLSQNLDAASSGAVLTFLKYIDNIIKHPGDAKYSRVPTSNKVFAEKISRVRGHEGVFVAAGFEHLSTSPREPSSFVVKSGVFASAKPSYWLRARKVLEEAAESLGLDEDEYAVAPAPSPLLPAEQAAAPAFEFDPFRAMVTRTALPASAGAATKDKDAAAGGAIVGKTTVLGSAAPFRSETEVLLAEIEARRLSLEGDPASVQRNTEVAVVFPESKIASVYLIIKCP
jgi:hypothetical protein